MSVNLVLLYDTGCTGDDDLDTWYIEISQCYRLQGQNTANCSVSVEFNKVSK